MTETQFNLPRYSPLLIVISGPSGVGKDTVIRRMKETHLPFHFVVTATTRPPRQMKLTGGIIFFIPKSSLQTC